MTGNQTSSFTRNVAFSGFTKAFQIAFNFAILGFVIKSVGIDNWGLLTYSLSVISLLSIVQLSISAAAAKRLTDFYYADDYINYNLYFSATIFGTLIILIGLIIIFLGTLFLPNVERLIQQNPTFLLVYICTFINSLFQILYLPFSSNLQATNRIDILSKIVLYGNVTRTALVFTLFYTFKNINTYTLILCFESALIAGISVSYSFKTNAILKVKLDKTAFQYISKIISFNIYNLINNVAYILFLQLPVLAISHNFPVRVVGFYGIGLQLNSILRQVVSILIIPLTTLFNILNSQKKYETLKVTYNFFKLLFMTIAFALMLNSTIVLKIIELYISIDTEYFGFIKYLLIFVAISVQYLPSSILSITFEKVKLTSLIGIFCSLICGIALYVLNDYDASIVPILMISLYLIYDVIRKLLVDKHLSTIKESVSSYSDLTWSVIIITIALWDGSSSNIDVLQSVLKNILLLIYIFTKRKDVNKEILKTIFKKT